MSHSTQNRQQARRQGEEEVHSSGQNSVANRTSITNFVNEEPHSNTKITHTQQQQMHTQSQGIGKQVHKNVYQELQSKQKSNQQQQQAQHTQQLKQEKSEIQKMAQQQQLVQKYEQQVQKQSIIKGCQKELSSVINTKQHETLQNSQPVQYSSSSQANLKETNVQMQEQQSQQKLNKLNSQQMKEQQQIKSFDYADSSVKNIPNQSVNQLQKMSKNDQSAFRYAQPLEQLDPNYQPKQEQTSVPQQISKPPLVSPISPYNATAFSSKYQTQSVEPNVAPHLSYTNNLPLYQQQQREQQRLQNKAELQDLQKKSKILKEQLEESQRLDREINEDHFGKKFTIAGLVAVGCLGACVLGKMNKRYAAGVGIVTFLGGFFGQML